MPAYHSAFNDDQTVRSVGGIALLPIKTKNRGPAPPPADPAADDIIDEAISLYRANSFFRNFEIKGNADRVLIYLTLYIQECLGKLTKLPNLIESQKILATHAVQNFAIPGDATFPLNAMYERPANRNDAELVKQYLTQLRQEASVRLAQRIFEDDKPSKWWMCFAKRKFMNLPGVGTSQ
ncbi:subunit of the Arp2/3 complex [Polyrhizophydium stewartii]|uniref:Actin-related protein 2/3 complex subunit 3 n=1 Tax=Polyrhizophydium stewartii TaxID=2732419 RepID=A0ABR4NCI3_9FUNG